MWRKYIHMFVFVMITVLMFGSGNLSVLAETVSDNHMLEEQQVQETELYEEAEFSLSGYCGLENENGGKNVSYTISDSDNDGTYDLLEIKGEGKIRESGIPDFSGIHMEYGLADLSNPLPWQIDDNRLKFTKVVIGEGVTDISSVCYCLRQLKEVSIPNSVTYIVGAAFYGCSSLEEINIPESVQSIGGAAFEGCSSLKKVNITNGVTYIGVGVFKGCSSLEEIHIPDSFQSIEWHMFENCSSLREVNIPNGVTDIGLGAFEGCSSLEKINIPESVQSIGQDSFRDCSSLREVNIPNSVTDIGWSAFEGCSSLKKVNISNSVAYIAPYAFKGCLSLEEIHIPESVQSILGNAFEDCSFLKKVSIPNSVTNIKESAFNGCSSLEEIHIPNSVQSIGSEAFRGCSSLKKINIPNGVTGIESWVFYGCSSLEEIHIPDSVQSIGRAAFGYCSSLKKINIPNSVTGIEDLVFWGCSSLEEIHISDSIRSIGRGVFGMCSSLKKVNIPNSITSISVQMFYYCSSLEEIHIPDSVQSIELYAFGYCSSLKKVNILNSVTDIGEFTFRGCSSLEEIYIPDSIQSIERYAFYECNSLKIVFLPSECKNVETAGFTDITSQIEYTIDNIGDAHISNIKLGKECALVEIPDMLYNYFILSVDESFRSLVSETGHTHKYNEAGICQICNKRKEQDEGAGIDTDIPEGPDTWKSKEGVEGFVFRLYNVAMNRDAEEAGLNDWNTRLNTKEETAAQVAWGFIFSKEFENFNYNDVQYVKLLYRTMFGREADKDGLEGWVSDLENGMSREYVFRGFAESQEFTNLCGNFGVERGNVSLNQYRDQNVGVTGFIARLYTQMLGRDFDEEGIEYWCRKYLTGENTIEEVATVGFLHSKELENLNLSDTEFVTRMYCTFLNREPDEAGLADWVNRLETGRGTRDSLVYGFTLSKEFGNIKALYGL